MEITISARDRLSTARRAGRIFSKRLHGRSTLVIVVLVGLVMGVALAAICSGVSLGGITRRESTDDAYVRADQIAISSHIAGYLESAPVQDNATVRQGQLVATVWDDGYLPPVGLYADPPPEPPWAVGSRASYRAAHAAWIERALLEIAGATG